VFVVVVVVVEDCGVGSGIDSIG